jgi:HEAT repeat protein
VPDLIGLLRDQSENSYLRRSAADALGQIGVEQALEALVHSLRDGNEGVRLNAVASIFLIGPD